jgi:hypothetical protein
MASPAVQNALASVGAIQGISQSYVDFTTKLVTDVMNALVASQISQMRAFADLVSTLERGLAAFKSQATASSVVIKWIEGRIPESGTDPTKIAVPANLSASSADIIANLYATKLVTILGAPANGGKYVLPSAAAQSDPSGYMTSLTGKTLTNSDVPSTAGTGTDYTNSANTLPAADSKNNIAIDLVSAVITMMSDDADNSYQQLDKLVQMGMMRVVVTDGHILTKMKFSMDTSDSSQHSFSDIYSSSFAVSASAGASWGWGGVSARTSYSSFNVQTSNDHSQTSTDIQVAITGEVLVNYKSDYFPQLKSQAKP